MVPGLNIIDKNHKPSLPYCYPFQPQFENIQSITHPRIAKFSSFIIVIRRKIESSNYLIRWKNIPELRISSQSIGFNHFLDYKNYYNWSVLKYVVVEDTKNIIATRPELAVNFLPSSKNPVQNTFPTTVVSNNGRYRVFWPFEVQV